MFLKVWKTIGNKLCALFVKEAKDLVLGGFQKTVKSFGKTILRRRPESEKSWNHFPLTGEQSRPKALYFVVTTEIWPLARRILFAKTADSLIVALDVSPKPLLCSLVTHN